MSIDIPAVSIIVPVYNVQDYLDECLESVFGQRFTDFEVILIDDGSTDKSSEICSRWSQRESRIRFYQQENSGLSRTRNFGIDVSKGEYLLFLDSDDRLGKDMLGLVYHKSKFNNVDVACISMDRFNPAGDIECPYACALNADDVVTGVEFFEQSYKHVNGINTMAQVYFLNSEFLKKIQLQFYPGIYHEDVLFTLMLLLRAGRVCCVSEAKYEYRLRVGSITANKSAKRVESIDVILRELSRMENDGMYCDAKAIIALRRSGVVWLRVTSSPNFKSLMQSCFMYACGASGLHKVVYAILRCTKYCANFCISNILGRTNI